MTITEAAKNNSISDNIILILAFIFSVASVFILYKPLCRFFKVQKNSGKFVCIIISVILLSFEFTGINKIFKAITSNTTPMPRFWYIYIIVFIVLIPMIHRTFKIKRYTITQLDSMDGHSFEYACADILKSNGFTNVKVTKGSGDFGVDIIAEKDKVRYAIQCKRYNHKLDNTPIQEVVGGLAYYQCNKGAVMTNQHFTEPAKKLAQVNKVELWDRDTLSRMLDKTKKTSDSQKKHKENRLNFPPMTTSDPLTYEAIKLIATAQNAETIFLQRKLRLGYSRAENILNEIELLELIGSKTEKGREIHITAEDLPYLNIQHQPQQRIKYQEYPTLEYAKKATMLNNLEEYRHMLEKFLNENAEYIVCYYKMTFDVDLKLEKIDVLYKQNSALFEFMYTPQLTTSKLKKSLKDLSEYINIENITFHSSCSIPGCFAIQVPMPEYLAKTSKFIDENSK